MYQLNFLICIIFSSLNSTLGQVSVLTLSPTWLEDARASALARVALRAKYRVHPAWLIKCLSIQLRKVDKADSMQRCFLSAKPELFNHKQANLKTSSVKVKSKILTTMTQKIDCKLNVLNLQALLREMQFACS